MSILKNNISYELQARTASSWSVIDVFYDEALATQEAETVWATGSHEALRLVREQMDPEHSTFSFETILHFGPKPPKTGMANDHTARPCWTAEHLYNFEGRQSITILLKDVLGPWQLTAMEILHHIDHYLRLDHSGTILQSAVQRGAVKQVKASGQGVQDRMKKLYEIISAGISRLNHMRKSGDITDISAINFDSLLQKAANREDRHFYLACLLAQHIKDNTTLYDKLFTLMQLVRPDHPAWVIKVMDGYIAGFFSDHALLSQMLGSSDTMATHLQRLCQLAAGKHAASHEDESCKRNMQRINNMLANRELPDTRRVLLGHVIKALAGGKKLSGDNLRDEMQAIHTIANTMRDQASRYDDTGEVLGVAAERAARLVTEYFVAEHIGNSDSPLASIEKILDLEPLIEGEEAKRKLANFIMPIVRAQENQRYFEALDGQFLERMRAIAHAQERVERSHLVPFHKQRVMQKLDDYCLSLMTKANIFDRNLDSGTMGRRLLTLLIEGYFTRGEALKLAQNEARLLLRQEGLIDSFVANENSDNKKKMLGALESALSRAGINPQYGQKQRA